MLFQPNMIVAGAAASSASNKALIKKVVGLIVVVVVGVAVVVIVLKVLDKFGDSSDDGKGETSFEGKHTSCGLSELTHKKSKLKKVMQCTNCRLYSPDSYSATKVGRDCRPQTVDSEV